MPVQPTRYWLVVSIELGARNDDKVGVVTEKRFPDYHESE